MSNLADLKFVENGGKEVTDFPKKTHPMDFFHTKGATNLTFWYTGVRKRSICGESRCFFGRKGVFVGTYGFC